MEPSLSHQFLPNDQVPNYARVLEESNHLQFPSRKQNSTTETVDETQNPKEDQMII